MLSFLLSYIIGKICQLLGFLKALIIKIFMRIVCAIYRKPRIVDYLLTSRHLPS